MTMSKVFRKFMRFLLRLDTQGQFETFGYFPLTESVRLQAAGDNWQSAFTNSII